MKALFRKQIRRHKQKRPRVCFPTCTLLVRELGKIEASEHPAFRSASYNRLSKLMLPMLDSFLP